MSRLLRFFAVRSQIAALFIFSILANVCAPTVALALTEGPSQPEFTQFEPFNATEMVDLFTGDFTYNIPLFELPGPNGGYPFNLAYQSGVTMDQEASWVGLGWSLNAGAINRQMRGLPDDFNGEKITQTSDMRKNWTAGATIGKNIEFLGGDRDEPNIPREDENGEDIDPNVLSLSRKIYYNNYRGLGYSTGVGISTHQFNKNKSGLGLDFNVDFDSQNGNSANAGLSYISLDKEYKDGSNEFKEASSSLGINASYNSRSGLTGINFAGSTKSEKEITVVKKGKDIVTPGRSGLSYSAPLTLLSQGYSPASNDVYTGMSIDVGVKIGGTVFGVDPNIDVSGFYTYQKMKYAGEPVHSPGFGLMYLDQDKARTGLLDFNRENDGTVYKSSPNLSTPVMTYDVYSVMGQGIGNMIRPYRSDIGVFYDKDTESKMFAGNLGLELGAGNLFKVGVDARAIFTNSRKKVWNNAASDLLAFRDEASYEIYEPFYFKSHGEMTVDQSGDNNYVPLENDPVRVQLAGLSVNPSLQARYVGKNGQSTAISTTNRSDREKRNSMVLPLTYQNLMTPSVLAGEDYTETLPIFNLNYYDGTQSNSELTIYNSTKQDYNRSERLENTPGQIAALTSTTPSGLNYHYGIPAYNNKHIESTFTLGQRQSRDNCKQIVDGSSSIYQYKNLDNERFLSKQELPPYAHSYLLTGITGAGYVDRTQNGLSQDDYGYWVNFEYFKTSNNYKWRGPFSGVNALDGLITKELDNKGAYMFGEKEIWYMAKAESSTHIAEFELSKRLDAKGPLAEKNINNEKDNQSLYKLDSIRLFSKKERFNADGSVNKNAEPIKVVHFKYDYRLAPDSPNSSASNKGKLTLKEIYFTYGNSNKGEKLPYIFNYSDVNKDYTTYNNDRWGSYKEGDECSNKEEPYVQQIPNNGETKEQLKEKLDDFASNYHLTDIYLPSGTEINVEYEMDDYAYVQNKKAMQMHQIVQTGTNTNGALDQDDLRVYFKLEEPVDVSTSAPDELVREQYSDKTGQIYFRTETRLLKSSNNNVRETVGGYAEIAMAQGKEIWGVGNAQNGKYTTGYVQLKPVEQGKGSYHPFSYYGAQYLMTSMPDIATSTSGYLSDPDQKNGKSFVGIIKGLFNVFEGDDLKNTFFGYYKNTIETKQWSTKINLENSFIRLNSPDGIKYGGGLRVKKLTYKDGTLDPNAEEYGQVYDYTTVENNEVISSGVAAYEPQVGGDENALKRAKAYQDRNYLKSNNNLFFEFPINESYYPAPVVGYSKITVKSLATDKQIKGDLNKYVNTTGAQVHEFYTAKDYPVITDETDVYHKPFKQIIPLPLIGSITTNNLTSTQGYSIQLNDMHGKPKKMASYPMNAKGELSENPISYVQYDYKHNEIYDYNINSDEARRVYVLDNKVDAIMNEGFNPVIEQVDLGLDYEFFTDMREDGTVSADVGARFNVNGFVVGLFPIVIPVVWPSLHHSTTELKTAVTNKVVHRTGILESTTVFQEGAVTTTKNLLYSGTTGAPLLTSVNNSFGDDIYSYSAPAHWYYDGMAHSSDNIGLEFTGELEAVDGRQGYYSLSNVPNSISQHYVAGDEYILTSERKKVIGYTDAFAQGNSYPFEQDLPYLDQGFNDNMGSINVPEGFIVHLYRDRDYQGPTLTLEAQLSPHNLSNYPLQDILGQRTWDDNVTSLKIEEVPLAKKRAIYKGRDGNNHIFKAVSTSGQLVSIVDDLENTHDFYLYRSGRTNQLTATAMAVTAMQDPTKNRQVQSKPMNAYSRTGSSGNYQFAKQETSSPRLPTLDNVIAMSGNTYMQSWQTDHYFTEEVGGPPDPDPNCNYDRSLLLNSFFSECQDVPTTCFGHIMAPTLDDSNPVENDISLSSSPQTFYFHFPLIDGFTKDDYSLYAQCNSANVNTKSLFVHPTNGKKYVRYEVEIDDLPDCQNHDVYVKLYIGDISPECAVDYYFTFDDSPPIQSCNYEGYYRDGSGEHYLDDFNLIDHNSSNPYQDLEINIYVKFNGFADDASYNWQNLQCDLTFINQWKENRADGIYDAVTARFDPSDCNGTYVIRVSSGNCYKEFQFEFSSKGLTQNPSQMEYLAQKGPSQPELVLQENYVERLDDDLPPSYLPVLPLQEDRSSRAWLPKASYVFGDDREQSTDVDLQRDGVVNDVPIFNPLFSAQFAEMENWLEATSITNYHADGVAAEERDVLDQYSSVQFGYDGTVVSATAANARLDEMAFENFEAIDEQVDEIESRFLFENNIPSDENFYLRRGYDVLAGEGPVMLIDKPFESWYNPGHVYVTAQNQAGENRYDYWEVQATYENQFDGKTVVELADNRAPGFNSGNRIWTGRAVLIEGRDINEKGLLIGKHTISDEESHTGEKSLKVVGTSNFVQPLFNLDEGEKYVLSAWVKLPSQYGQQHSYTPDTFKIRMGNNSANLRAKGKIIEGWQQFEVEFTKASTGELFYIDIGNAGDPVYVDDIRIYPVDGAMVSNVYDPANYRLQAMLDANNYATFYYYDDEGNLTLIKKETEEGIKTIQESFTHIRETP